MANFKKAFDLMIVHEGGYVNDPDDPGGETYKGVARKIHPKWLGWTIIDLLKKQKGFPDNLHLPGELEIMKQLNYEVSSFYYDQFWLKIKGDSILDQTVANSIFDFAVNAGIVPSVQLAQTVVKVTPDGAIGPKTITAINAFDTEHFLAAFAVAKIGRYIEICNKRPLSKKYFFGWTIRTLKHIN
jgi:lysozyme family protein